MLAALRRCLSLGEDGVQVDVGKCHNPFLARGEVDLHGAGVVIVIVGRREADTVGLEDLRQGHVDNEVGEARLSAFFAQKSRQRVKEDALDSDTCTGPFGEGDVVFVAQSLLRL